MGTSREKLAVPSQGSAGAVPRWKDEELLAAILESASQAMVTVDRGGRMILANARCESMFGYKREELEGQVMEMLLPEAFRQGHVSYRAEYFSQPRVRPMGVGLDLMGRRKDGTDFPVEISLSYIQPNGELLAIAFITDITERKRLEDQLLQSQKMEAVGRLAGGVAHDFNNMLTIITGFNQMLLDQLSTVDPLRGHAEEILKAANRAAALTHQLLAFSRRQMSQPRLLDINSVIRDAVKMIGRLIGEDVELTVKLQPGIGTVRADPRQIEQVILNLATNSRDAMPIGGQLTIETAGVELDKSYARTHLGVQPGPYVMLALSDTGAGMTTEVKKHIFEPFFTTKEPGKGTGLGLSTVYGIVKQNGGDIWLYSEPGKGTTFKIYLPRVAGETEEVSEQRAAVPEKGHGTILVVEDEEGVRHLLRHVLAQHGYTVLEAGDSADAIQASAAHQGKIDLLLTDVILPKASGRQVAQRLLTERPDMRILFISGYTENAIAHHGVIDAGVHFLSKPFTTESLLAKIREVLQ